MKTTKTLLGERIRDLRKKQLMSQEVLAEKIQIDAKNLSRIEVGRGYPSLDTLEKIAGALGLEIRDLFDFDHLQTLHHVAASVQTMIKSANEEELRKFYLLAKHLIK